MIPPKRFDIFFHLDSGMLKRSRRVMICLLTAMKYYIVRCTFPAERFPMEILAEIARISARIFVENLRRKSLGRNL